MAKEKDLLKNIEDKESFYDTPPFYAGYPDLLPMKHSNVTDAIATIGRGVIETNPISDETTITTKSGIIYKIVARKGTQLPRISTDKLLKVMQAEFTKNVTVATDRSGKKYIVPDVTIPIARYAVLRKKDISKKAVKDKLRKEVNEDLKILIDLQAFIDDEKNELKGYHNLIATAELKKNEIHLVFNPSIAKYLYNQPITQFPPELLALDGRSDNAYVIGTKLYARAFMSPNLNAGTADRISVKKLLEGINLKTYEEILKEGRGWHDLLERFETALDKLEEEKIIKCWQYRKPGGDRLSDKELEFNRYEDWEKSMIFFELPEKYKKSQKEILLKSKSKKKTKKEKIKNETKKNGKC